MGQEICIRMTWALTLVSSAFKTLPTLDYDIVTEDGEPCFVGTWYNNGKDRLVAEGDPVLKNIINETNAFISIDKPKGLATYWTLHLHGKLKPRQKDTKFEFGLTVAGRAKVKLGTFFFAQ